MGQDLFILILYFLLCLWLRHGVVVGRQNGDEKNGVSQEKKKREGASARWSERIRDTLSFLVEALLLVPSSVFFFFF